MTFAVKFSEKTIGRGRHSIKNRWHLYDHTQIEISTTSNIEGTYVWLAAPTDTINQSEYGRFDTTFTNPVSIHYNCWRQYVSSSFHFAQALSGCWQTCLQCPSVRISFSATFSLSQKWWMLMCRQEIPVLLAYSAACSSCRLSTPVQVRCRWSGPGDNWQYQTDLLARPLY